MLRMEWSPNDLIADMARLLDAGWAAIAFWCERPSAQKTGFIVAGPSPSDRAQASEALRRVHAERGMPAMRMRKPLLY